ncbi:riboflavin synthase subunit alpha [Thiosulfatimonas sediminis]|uniref:Riboflavin synthase n=1 Tax=Thiosulfatimonas sediminis TaxID=2675054 RepID=A0A6F8PU92_9GAMM|nr:riboflavin synthase [Thiosulfatimonas sediminis]BBP45701.1 riboflavin synthase subunit alpha [Thiosulfatimonas sediminis]
MFTGIIAAEGSISKIEPRNGDWKVTIHTGKLDMSDVALGDSIAANGICLTAIEFGRDYYVADVSGETLSVTTAAEWQSGTPVNLEKALRLQDRLGGHLVSGHVDGVGRVKSIAQDARSWRYQIEAPLGICKYIAAKGSICINGISLTVNKVEGCVFDVNIVPHTRQETTIKHFQVGTKVNLEVDLLARYLERMLHAPSQEQPTTNITEQFLAENGFK